MKFGVYSLLMLWIWFLRKRNANKNLDFQRQLQYILKYKRWHSITVQLMKKLPYLFQHNLSYRNETGTNHHGLLSTSVWCFKIFLRDASTWGGGSLYLTLNFLMLKPKFEIIINLYYPQCRWTPKKNFKASNWSRQ